MTNASQDDSNTYSDNTINNVDDSIEDINDDNSAKDAEATKVDNTCKIKDKSTGRGGRKKKMCPEKLH